MKIKDRRGRGLAITLNGNMKRAVASFREGLTEALKAQDLFGSQGSNG